MLCSQRSICATIYVGYMRDRGTIASTACFLNEKKCKILLFVLEFTQNALFVGLLRCSCCFQGLNTYSFQDIPSGSKGAQGTNQEKGLEQYHWHLLGRRRKWFKKMLRVLGLVRKVKVILSSSLPGSWSSMRISAKKSVGSHFSHVCHVYTHIFKWHINGIKW